MICTGLKAGSVPNEVLAVDVSTLTLTSVVVVPAMGAMAGAVVGGSAVCVANGIEVAGRVAVMNSVVGIEEGVDAVSHPLKSMEVAMRRISFLWVT